MKEDADGKPHRVDDVASFEVFGGDEDLLRGLIAFEFAGVDGHVHALGREVIIITYRSSGPCSLSLCAPTVQDQKLTFDTGSDLTRKNIERGKLQYIRMGRRQSTSKTKGRA